MLERFGHVMTAHYVISTELQALSGSAEAGGKDQWRDLYSANAMWATVQDVTQELLSVHLRSAVLSGDATPASSAGAPAFRRRLFSFAASSAAFEYVEQDGTHRVTPSQA